ncbi:MAG: alpha-xylosidase [Opitutales bacterium]|nr:alpha-xylosidase [Opitutales bacterium]
MKPVNHPVVDFLDFDPSFAGPERLWRALKPTRVETDGPDVCVTVPFQAQKPGVDIVPDREVAPVEHCLRLRAYGPAILRVAVDAKGGAMTDSEMIELRPDLAVDPLRIESGENEWRVVDGAGAVRARFLLGEPATDPWSDLLPPPEPTLEAIFYPDGKRAVPLRAYDQFFPARHDAFALAFVKEGGVVKRSALSLAAGPDECFAGTGERFAKMDLAGRTFHLVNQDGQGVNSRRTYKNVPFYLSSRLYGAFVHTSAPTGLSLTDHSTRSVQVMTEESGIDLFLMAGESVEEVIFHYRSLTGFPSVPPLWSFGVWMSRMTYFSADEVERICDRLRAEDFPCDVIHLDTGWFRTDWLCEWKFNPERFPDPPAFVEGLRKRGFKVSLWQMPYIAEKAEQHEEAVANRYIGPLKETRRQGGSNFSALDYAGTIDFTYPKAVEWYKGLLRRLLEMGVVCIKTDFGETIHLNAEYHGMPAHTLNNLYGLLYQKAAFEVTKEVTGDGIVWARAGWAGCQRYPLHWGGDAAATWDGLAASLRGGLHLGLSGFGFWSHDIPGFHGVPDFMNSVIPDDLYVRWTQFGVFSSHMRYHGTSKREPYEYPRIAGIVRRWFKLRYALIPYILRESERCATTGYPVLRALAFHWPEDKTVWHIDDQYCFGGDLLVAPVMNSEGVRDVYLPEGRWVHFFTGEAVSGGRWLRDVRTPMDEMPVWVRHGAVVPVHTRAVSNTDEMDLGSVREITADDGFAGIFNYIDAGKKV